MLAILGLIPGLMTLIQFVVGKAFDAKVKLTQARLGVDKDVAIGLVKATAQESHENTNKLAIYAGSTLLTFMIVGFAVPLILFIWKIVVVDIIIGPGCLPLTHLCWIGETDPIRGQVADWATTIIGFLFGSSATVTIGKMWFNRDKAGE